MSYQLQIWKNVNKKINSTYQPSSTPDYTLDVVLKEDTSISRPIFLLDLDDWRINYCRFQGRYYFINDIRRNITGQVEIECNIDVLATFKDYIGGYEAFVERSDSEFDPLIYDEAITTQSGIKYSSHETKDIMYSQENPGGILSSTGCFLLRTVGYTHTYASATGINTYIVDYNDLNVIFDFMFNDGNYSDIFSDMVVKSFFNPFQYIVDLRWVPFTKEYFRTALSGFVSVGTVLFGWWAVKQGTDYYTTYILEKTMFIHSINLAVPYSHYGNGDFRRYNSRFTQYKLYLFNVGCIDISPVDIQFANDFEGVKIRVYYDLTSGEMTTILLRADGYNIIGQWTTTFAIPVQISQVNSNLFSSIQDVIKTTGTSLQAGAMAEDSGSKIASMVGGSIKIGASIVNAIKSEVAAGVSGNGSNGNRGTILAMPYYTLFCTQYESCGIARIVNGRPLYQNRYIRTLGGYIKCSGASIEIPGFADEKEQVNNALNGGFYYE